MKATWPVEQRRLAESRQPMGVYMRLFSVKKPVVLPSRAAFEPATDVYETDSEVVVRVDVAGADRARVNVRYMPETGELIIRGHRSDPAAGRERDYHQLEVVYGPFERVVRIPGAVDADNVRADYCDGLLHVHLPKLPPRADRTYTISID
jgi:HSP20 family molecular chaperone IbpA